MDKEDLPEAESAGRTIQEELEQLKRAYPNKRGPRLANARSPKSARFATLWVLLKNSDAELALHKSLFVKKKAMSAGEWAEYFKTHVFKGWNNQGNAAQRDGILEGAIIPGVDTRGNSTHSLYSVIGYAIQKSVPAAVLRSWNQTREARR